MQLTLQSSESTSTARVAVPPGWSCPEGTVTSRTVLLPLDQDDRDVGSGFTPNVTVSLDPAAPGSDLVPAGGCEVGRRREVWSDGRGEVAMRIDTVGDGIPIVQLAAASERSGHVLAVVCSASAADWASHATAFDELVAATFESEQETA